MTVNPVVALLVFIVLSIVLFLLWKFNQSRMFLQKLKQNKKMLTEDILKQLYHVEAAGRFATFNGLAGALKLSDKKLLELVEEMTATGLVGYTNSQVKLNPSGRDYALKIVRVHRLWEKYLSERTGFDRKEWHDLAEKKEHTLSEKETDELYEALGNPRFDPHGDPIPTVEGEIVEPDWTPLSALEAGITARIVHLEDEPEVIYQQLVDLKLHIGSHLKVESNGDHEINFHSEGRNYTISTIVASNISVKELKGEETYQPEMIRLSMLAPGETAEILGLSPECRGAARRRLLDLGFTRGSAIETEFENPLNEPKAYSIRNTLIALRNDQADMVLIKKNDE